MVKCIGAESDKPCDEPAQVSYILPVCTDHQAAVMYKLERGGFSFDQQELSPRALDDRDREVLRPLARYLCASAIAYRARISLGYGLKKYVTETPGELYFVKARELLDDVQRAMDGRFGAPSRPDEPDEEAGSAPF